VGNFFTYLPVRDIVSNWISIIQAATRHILNQSLMIEMFFLKMIFFMWRHFMVYKYILYPLVYITAWLVILHWLVLFLIVEVLSSRNPMQTYVGIQFHMKNVTCLISAANWFWGFSMVFCFSNTDYSKRKYLSKVVIIKKYLNLVEHS
jgi:hypothetical protein